MGTGGSKCKEYLGSDLGVGSDGDSCSVRWGQGRKERFGEDGLWLPGVAAPGGAPGGGAEWKGELGFENRVTQTPASRRQEGKQTYEESRLCPASMA